MRLVVQRVSQAKVKVDHQIVGEIDKGYLVYVGIKESDTKDIVKKAAQKVHTLRVFEDDEGKMNLNLSTANGKILAISQFTLYGDTKGNNRPSFIEAARPEHALPLFDFFIETLKKDHHVEKGVFGAKMMIESINDGPVTIIMEFD